MAARPRDMEHIDREELYTSLPARISYLHSFLEFDRDDVEALISGQRYIKTVIPAIVNMVYKKLLRHDITARVFTNRDSRNEEDPEQWVSEDGAQIKHRKMFLRWYLTKLNSDPSRMEYWEYLDKVGLMHVGRGRRNPLHVDYVFLGACLGYIQSSLTEAILSHPRLPLEKKIAVVKAIGKVIWIQNDLLARWHVTDGAEYGDPAEEQEIEAEAKEPEGYLHGKKMLGVGSDDDGSSVRSGDSGRTSLGRPVEERERDREQDMDDKEFKELMGRCPFSGMERQRVTMRPKEKDVKTLPHNDGVVRLELQQGKAVRR